MKAWTEMLVERFEWLDENINAINKRRHTSQDEMFIHDTLLNQTFRLYSILETLDDGSCNLGCGGLCCFFPREFSVQLDLDTVEKIRFYLKGKGAKFDDYVRKCWYDRLPDEMKDALDEVHATFVEKGIKKAYEVTSREGQMDKSEIPNIPRAPDGRLLWTDADSSPCAFLTDDRRCSLYAAGIKPVFCTEFICSVNIALKVAKQLGYLSDKDTAGLPFPKLKRLSDDIFDTFETLMKYETEYHTAFIEMGKKYISGDDIAEPLERFKGAEKKYLRNRRKLFKSAIHPNYIDHIKKFLAADISKLPIFKEYPTPQQCIGRSIRHVKRSRLPEETKV
ncbi:MAG: hypothetical protein KKD39_04845 [Candidatus Altiarchaeota archaeon]|nr:hypothetical protein [Candidatus Altiarchaeota archaeon]